MMDLNNIKKYLYILSSFFTKDYYIMNLTKGELSLEFFEITFTPDHNKKDIIKININGISYDLPIKQFVSVIERCIVSNDFVLFNYLSSSLTPELIKILNKKYNNKDQYVLLSSFINDSDIIIKDANEKPLCGFNNVKRNNTRILLTPNNKTELFLSFKCLEKSFKFFSLEEKIEQLIQDKNALILQIHNQNYNKNVYKFYLNKLYSDKIKEPDYFWIIDKSKTITKETNSDLINAFAETNDIKTVFLLSCNIYQKKYKDNVFANLTAKNQNKKQGAVFNLTLNPYENIKNIFI